MVCVVRRLFVVCRKSLVSSDLVHSSFSQSFGKDRRGRRRTSSSTPFPSLLFHSLAADRPSVPIVFIVELIYWVRSNLGSAEKWERQTLSSLCYSLLSREPPSLRSLLVVDDTSTEPRHSFPFPFPSLNNTWTPLVGGLLTARLGTPLASIMATSLILIGQATILFFTSSGANGEGSIKGMLLGIWIFSLGVSPLAVVQETISALFFLFCLSSLKNSRRVLVPLD